MLLDINVVVDRPRKDLPVYDIRKLNGTRRVLRLHRSLFLLYMCNSLPVLKVKKGFAKKQGGSRQNDTESRNLR